MSPTKTLILLREIVRQAIKNEDFRTLLEISKAMSDISKEITEFTKSITVEDSETNYEDSVNEINNRSFGHI